MIGIVLALFSALVYSLSAVLTKRRLNRTNFTSAALITVVTGNVVIWPLALLSTNLGTVSLEGLLFFAIAGILTPGIARLVYFKGIEVVGVSVNASIIATYPMYISILAVLFLGETLTPENWIGLICIMASVVCIERSLSTPKIGPKGIFKKGLVFPLLATLTNTFSFILRKHALNICNTPLFGVAIGYSSSLLVFLIVSISSHTMRSSMFSSRDFRFFWKAGAGISLGYILTFLALSQEKVSIVTPLIETQPLFVLVFAHLYLKELEHISFKLVISALLVIIGVMLVTIP